MIHWFDNFMDRNDNHVSGGEMVLCFVITSIVLNNITFGTILTWESLIKSLCGFVVLVMTLAVNDLYKEYLKPKFIKILKVKNGKQKRRKSQTEKRA